MQHLLSPVICPKTQQSNWPYSLIRFEQDNSSQQGAETRHYPKNTYHKIRLRRPQKGCSKTYFDDPFGHCKCGFCAPFQTMK
jgi:hypothetical protein